MWYNKETHHNPISVRMMNRFSDWLFAMDFWEQDRNREKINQTSKIWNYFPVYFFLSSFFFVDCLSLLLFFVFVCIRISANKTPTNRAVQIYCSRYIWVSSQMANYLCFTTTINVRRAWLHSNVNHIGIIKSRKIKSWECRDHIMLDYIQGCITKARENICFDQNSLNLY